MPTVSKKSLDHKILIAEDDLSNVLALTAVLINLGFKKPNINRAINGVEAVDMARTTKYDLIFMDRQMPDMDGILATKTIRKGGGLNIETPIIALTAGVLSQSRSSCLAAGHD